MLTITAYGPLAALVEGLTPAEIRHLARALATPPWPTLTAALPTLTSLTLVFASPPPPLPAIANTLTQLCAAPIAPEQTPAHHTIPVAYTGPDLAAVAAACGLAPAEVVALHSQARYEVAFLGFLPGFAYLTGLPKALWLPRRATPRPRVPPGAVAIANDQAAIYPQASPGGWHLLGTTPLTLFDPAATPPTLLQPGDTVAFVPIETASTP